MVLNVSQALNSEMVLEYCEAYWCKLRGLAWRRKLVKSGGIVLASKSVNKRDSAIHMMGMFFDLSIIWLDGNMQVVDKALALKWRSFLVPKTAARYVIECAPSRIHEFGIGDHIAFEKR